MLPSSTGWYLGCVSSFLQHKRLTQTDVKVDRDIMMMQCSHRGTNRPSDPELKMVDHLPYCCSSSVRSRITTLGVCIYTKTRYIHGDGYNNNVE